MSKKDSKPKVSPKETLVKSPHDNAQISWNGIKKIRPIKNITKKGKYYE